MLAPNTGGALELGLEAGTKFLQGVMEEINDTEEGEDLMKSIRIEFSSTVSKLDLSRENKGSVSCLCNHLNDNQT